jgi:hypothetical protein
MTYNIITRIKAVLTNTLIGLLVTVICSPTSEWIEIASLPPTSLKFNSYWIKCLIRWQSLQLEGINVFSDFQNIDTYVSLLYDSCLLNGILYCRNDVRLITLIKSLHRQRKLVARCAMAEDASTPTCRQGNVQSQRQQLARGNFIM